MSNITFKTLKRIWSAVMLTALADVLSVLFAAVMGKVMGVFAESLLYSEWERITSIAVTVGICIIGSTLIVPLIVLAGNTIFFYESLNHDRDILNNFMHLPYDKQCSISPGEADYRLESDPNEYRYELLLVARNIVGIPISAGVLVWLLKSQSWYIVIITLCVIFIKLIANQHLGKIKAEKNEIIRDNNSTFRSYDIDFSMNRKHYSSLDFCEKALESYKRIFERQFEKELGDAIKSKTFIEELQELLSTQFYLLILIAGYVGITRNWLMVSEIVTAIIVFPAIERTVSGLEVCVSHYPNLKILQKRMEFFNVKESVDDKKFVRGDIELKDVNYAYDSRLILQNFSAEMTDKKIAIIGENGSGKSTILKIICGFLQLYKGNVIVDGIMLKGRETSWYKKISYIPQEPQVYEANLEENIAYSNTYDSEMMEKAISATGLDELRGRILLKSSVSGGELQRISIARAIYSNRDIIIMDEPDKHIDKNTQQWLKNFIATTEGKVIFVTHDNDLVRLADKVVNL